jgi:hypothetical protein
MPALYPIPGFSTHPDHIRAHTISPHKPGSAILMLSHCFFAEKLRGGHFSFLFS